MKRQIILGYFFLLIGISLFAQNNSQVDVKGVIAWNAQQIDASVSLNLPSAGIVLPNGRVQAEDILDTEFPRLIQQSLFPLLIDSSNILGDLINKNEYSLYHLSNAVLSAEKIPPSLSLDMQSMTSRYTIDLKHIRSDLVKHRRPAETPKTLSPIASRAYTGIVIFADTEVTIHGRHSKALPVPCLFPKIWDSQMNLIYEKNMVNPSTAKNQGIVNYVDASAVFRETPSGMNEELINLVGNNPLRIIAQGVFGVNPTDPIINREDSLIIISNEANRKLLQEGRVVIVLNSSVLRENFTSK
jgi:hypothetical protein